MQLFPSLLRLPPAKRRVAEKQKEGQEKDRILGPDHHSWAFLIEFPRILHEECFKGIGMLRLHPSTG